jgi:hypothetical protein
MFLNFILKGLNMKKIIHIARLLTLVVAAPVFANELPALSTLKACQVVSKDVFEGVTVERIKFEKASVIIEMLKRREVPLPFVVGEFVPGINKAIKQEIFYPFVAQRLASRNTDLITVYKASRHLTDEYWNEIIGSQELQDIADRLAAPYQNSTSIDASSVEEGSLDDEKLNVYALQLFNLLIEDCKDSLKDTSILEDINEGRFTFEYGFMWKF